MNYTRSKDLSAAVDNTASLVILTTKTPEELRNFTGATRLQCGKIKKRGTTNPSFTGIDNYCGLGFGRPEVACVHQ